MEKVGREGGGFNGANRFDFAVEPDSDRGVEGLASIVGQERAVGRLRAALASGKAHHAYLFEGPDGVGKHTTALGLAQAWNCEESPGEGCGRCGPCAKIDAGTHP